MTTRTVDPAIADYVSRCEEHLRDLPPDVRGQLRDDIEQIVAEVAAELGGAPDDLVGPPLRFVIELRAAAGLDAPPSTGALDPDTASPSRTLRDRLRAITAHPSVRWCRTLAPQLRPAWWVLRGVLVAVAIGRVTGADGPPVWVLVAVPVWPVLGNLALGLATTAGAVYLSVEAERRPLDRTRRWLRAAASATAIITAALLVADVRDWSQPRFEYVPQDQIGMTGGIAGSAAVVTIGSDTTGVEMPVISLDDALAMVDQLAAESPPIAIYLTYDGTRTHPGTTEQLRAVLDDLVARGYLNPSPAPPGGTQPVDSPG